MQVLIPLLTLCDGTCSYFNTALPSYCAIQKSNLAQCIDSLVELLLNFEWLILYVHPKTHQVWYLCGTSLPVPSQQSSLSRSAISYSELVTFLHTLINGRSLSTTTTYHLKRTLDVQKNQLGLFTNKSVSVLTNLNR